jgi:L-ribulose-5-phosphate 3-epimerase
MKLGVITDELTQDINKAVQFAKKYELDGVELRSIEDMSIDEIPVERIKEIKGILQAEGLEVCALSSSFFKCSIDSEKEYKDNIEKLKRVIERAHILHCDKIRSFAFFKSGEFESRLSEIVEKFAEPAEIIKKENVNLVLESDPSVFTANLRKLSILIKALNNPLVKGLYDPGNDIFDPEFESPYPEGFNYIKPYIEHVHIKDAKLIKGKPEAVKIGTGDVPYKEIFKELKEMNYNGYVVLETHYRISHGISEELLKRPKGSLFSLRGEIASEESMVELKRLLREG